MARLAVHLAAAAKISEPAEYDFATSIAAGWLACTGRMPSFSGSRDKSPSRDGTKGISTFQQFVEAIAPRVGSETIRSVVEAFNAVK